MGIGAQSALNLINASAADTYPVHLRATALGWSNGVGRLGAVAAPQLGGWLLAPDSAPKRCSSPSYARPSSPPPSLR